MVLITAILMRTRADYMRNTPVHSASSLYPPQRQYNTMDGRYILNAIKNTTLISCERFSTLHDSHECFVRDHNC